MDVRVLTLTALLVLVLAAPAAAAPRDGWIINGTKAQNDAYPWQVALTMGGSPAGAGGQFCGGTLVSPTVVVTAAHCTEGLTASGLKVFANQTDLRDPGQTVAVSAISTPAEADLDDAAPLNDVSVLTLAGAGVTGAKPIDLVGTEGGADDDLWGPGDPLVVTGWGLVNETNLANELFAVELDRIDDTACDQAWDGDVDPASMVCAGVALNAAATQIGGGRDSCNGDSGGGLLGRTTTFGYPFRAEPWRLVGIVSWGSTPCDQAGLPGVYTRVAAPIVHDHIAGFLSGDPAPATPQPDGPPLLTGTAEVGQAVHCASPGWGGQDVDETYEIFRVGANVATRVATGPDYTITTADRTRSLACLVTATPQARRRARLRGVRAARPGPRRDDDDADHAHATRTTTSTPIQPATTAARAAPPAARRPPPRRRPPAPVPTPRDESPPRAAAVGRSCRARRCTITVAVSDLAPSAGIRAVSARVTYRVRRRCGKRTCLRTRTRTVTGTRRAGSVFVVRTPKLPKGRITVRLTATDRAGNVQSVPTVARLKLR